MDVSVKIEVLVSAALREDGLDAEHQWITLPPGMVVEPVVCPLPETPS